jgi:hypothetical protein
VHQTGCRLPIGGDLDQYPAHQISGGDVADARGFGSWELTRNVL